MPFVNAALAVEAVGFREFEEHQLGVLITPWFVNLVILPVEDLSTTHSAGAKITIQFPSGPIEFTVASDEVLGTYLSAVLFSSVSDIPNQETARMLADEVMCEVFNKTHKKHVMSRRALFSGASTA